MWIVASRAFSAKTGLDNETYYEHHAPDVSRRLIGKLFDEDTVAERHPDLAARFS
jgi:hypothetical protein